MTPRRHGRDAVALLPASLLGAGLYEPGHGLHWLRLGWRTVDFEREAHDIAEIQGAAVNHADEDVPYTRIHEFKDLHPERHHPLAKSTIHLKYS